MENSEFLQQSIELLRTAIKERDVKEIICLGIGRIAECSIAKHQLAFISVISKQLSIPDIKFFDPVLSVHENNFLESLNYKVLSENTEGKYLTTHPTLFYLPHCPKQITNNLLFTNWKPENIENLLLICNSFKSIIETTPERFLRPNAHYILEINQATDELEIKNNFIFSDIFNDFAIHAFPREKVSSLPDEFWENKPAPHYTEEDLEIITNGSR